MNQPKKIVLEALLVIGVGSLLGVVANALSPRGLALRRNYFPDAGALPSSSATAAASASAPTLDAAKNSVSDRLRARGLQALDREAVIRLFRDPRYAQGLVVFIDARAETEFAAGHIPRARLFYHYRAEDYLPKILPACLTATHVVVYCSGGDCDDSEFAAIMLRDAGVAPENLFVYPGGFNEWSRHGLPLETGATHHRESGGTKGRSP